jgi:hypothetical protein
VSLKEQHQAIVLLNRWREENGDRIRALGTEEERSLLADTEKFLDLEIRKAAGPTP